MKRLSVSLSEIVIETFRKNYRLTDEGARKMFNNWRMGFPIDLTGGR